MPEIANIQVFEHTRRRRFPARLLAACCLAALSLGAQAAPTLTLGNVNVVDVDRGRIDSSRTVTIRGSRIEGISAARKPRSGETFVDGQGAYLIPGLWDMHAHVPEMWLALYVANGVTSIRDMGNDLDEILQYRQKTMSGELLGPSIFTAGVILDDAPGEWPLRMRVKNAAEARAAVRLLKQRGVDRIKSHNFTPRDAFFAMADEARRVRLPLAGHVPLKVTIQEAVDAGITSIEHLSEDGRVWKWCSGGNQYRPDLCRPFFETLARRRVWQTPTLRAMSEVLTIGTPISSIDPVELVYASKYHRQGWAMNQDLSSPTPQSIGTMRQGAALDARVTADMARAGVGILVGCDMMIAGFCVHDELEALVGGGMTPLAALQAATLNPAKYFSLERTAGSVAPGRRADLVLLDANPLEDIKNTRRIRGVVLAGRMLDRQRLDEMLAEVKKTAETIP